MKNYQKENDSKGIVRVIVTLLAAIGLITAIVVAVDVIYKKYKKCLSSFNSEDTLDGLGDDCFDDDCLDCPEESSVDCDFAE